MKGPAAARTALLRGDLATAGEAARAMIVADPQGGEGYFLVAMVAAEAGQIGKAVPLVEQALVLEPENSEYLAQYARLLILLRRDGEAGAAVHRAMEAEPQDARTLDTIGCVLARLGDHERSVVPFQTAVALEPDNLDYRYNHAAACGFTGRVDTARAEYERILSADPGNARAHYALAILSRQTREENHVERLSRALDAARKPADHLRLRYALAKELEDVGETGRAFDALALANAEHKQHIQYEFSQDEKVFDALEAAFGGLTPTEPVFQDAGGPIFVVGMPRTGTTLVDRILSSHSDVVSAGELQAMPLAVKQAAGTRSRLVIDAETVSAALVPAPGRIRELYLARAKHHVSPGVRRFVDKLPANFLYVGHIARSFPEARIVCLLRHPMDTVWSNFRNLFASQSAYYAYSYDLMDTARYYVRFMQLMDMWDRLYPGRVLQFSYEALVADQERQTRTLLEHCGLAWDPACLSFHENRSAVATPSAAQVRRGLNADGVGRWKAHREHMEPVRTFFEQHGIPVD